MRKLLIINCFAACICVNCVKAQTAMDFSMTDCSTNTMHNLYQDYLDNEEVVIIEFFMTCSSCIQVGQAITPMFNQLSLDYPGMVNFFAFNFNDDFDCSVANNFVTTFGINAVPFDSGAAQLAYYGGFGMPTVAIVGGSQHEILYFDKEAVVTGDTAIMDSVIRNFFTHLGSEPQLSSLNLNIYPNPTKDQIYVTANFNQGESYILQLTDIVGTMLMKKKMVGSLESLDISTLAKGSYYVNLIGAGTSVTKKLILE